jgi:hypothetical protein
MSAHRRAIVLLFLLLVSSVLAPSLGATQQCGPEAVTSLGTWFSPGVILKAGEPFKTVQSDSPSATRAMKLLLAVTAGTDRDWNLVIRDLDYRPLASFGAEDFRDANGGLSARRWTGLLPVSRARADLIATPASDIRIEVYSGIAFPNESSDMRLFSIVRKNGDPWYELYEKNNDVLPKRAGDSVGMLVVGMTSPTGARGSWCCSGVMLSSDIMLTNWHCGGSREVGMQDADYWRGNVCENTVVDLGWAKGASSRQYSCTGVLVKNRQLDFALIRLRPVVGAGGVAGAPVRARISDKTPTDGLDIFVVHHAKCAQKLVSSQCKVRTAPYPGWKETQDGPDPAGSAGQLKSDFSHDCNTEGGASGSPVFDATGRLVGLHHLGVKRDAQCLELDDENKAVSFREIADFLRREKPEIARELSLP